MNPLKQGLKLRDFSKIMDDFLAFIHESIKTRVETELNMSSILTCRGHLSMNPLKQGLKLLHGRVPVFTGQSIYP